MIFVGIDTITKVIGYRQPRRPKDMQALPKCPDQRNVCVDMMKQATDPTSWTYCIPVDILVDNLALYSF